MRELRIRIAGTGASNILGCGHITNQEYWSEFIHGKRDFTNPLLIGFAEYGKAAEEPLVTLFSLDNPSFLVRSNKDLIVSQENSFMVGIPDAYLLDKSGNRGILEIKTKTVFSKNQYMNVLGDFVDTYYWQIVHYLLVEKDLQYAICKMQIKRNWNEDILVKSYYWERSVLQDSIDLLEKEEILFMQYVYEKKKPPLRLPSI